MTDATSFIAQHKEPWEVPRMSHRAQLGKSAEADLEGLLVRGCNTDGLEGWGGFQ